MKTYIIMPHYIVTEELKKLAINAIKSFRDNSADRVIIVSVDDGSPMDCTFLKELSDVYLKNDENSGFGVTCNKGFQYVLDNDEEDAYIVCANNDIEVYKDWQWAMKDPFDCFNDVAITGLISCKDRNPNGIPIADFKLKSRSKGGLLCGWMQSGGLWMSTKKVLQKIGVFDEQFLRGGYEDVDIFLRARDTFGMKIIMSGWSMFWHKEGATRWNDEKNEYINGFKQENKDIEEENRKKFMSKWGYDYNGRQVWRQIDQI